MSFEQDIAAQTTASDTLTGLYAGKVSDINLRIAAKDHLINDLMFEVFVKIIVMMQ